MLFLVIRGQVVRMLVLNVDSLGLILSWTIGPKFKKGEMVCFSQIFKKKLSTSDTSKLKELKGAIKIDHCT